MSINRSALVSVLIPIYNSGKWLSKCLDSVVDQTYKNIEILLYDDGSVDNSAELYNRYIELDSRIRLIGKGKVGIAKARDILIQEAKGYASLFIDSDDWIEHNMIEVMVNLLLADNLDYCGCSMFYDENDGKSVILASTNESYSIFNKKDIIKQYVNLAKLHGSLCNKLIRTEILKKHKFNGEWDFAEDASFMWSVVNDVNRVGLTSTPLYHYCRHNDSLSEWKFKETHLNFVELWKRIVDDIQTKYPDLIFHSRATLAYIVMSTLHSMMVIKNKDRQLYDYLMGILSEHRLQYLRHPKGGFKYMMFLCALSVSLNLAYTGVNLQRYLEN